LVHVQQLAEREATAVDGAFQMRDEMSHAHEEQNTDWEAK
jgi:hypothetical protein